MRTAQSVQRSTGTQPSLALDSRGRVERCIRLSTCFQSNFVIVAMKRGDKRCPDVSSCPRARSTHLLPLSTGFQADEPPLEGETVKMRCETQNCHRAKTRVGQGGYPIGAGSNVIPAFHLSYTCHQAADSRLKGPSHTLRLLWKRARLAFRS